MAESMYTPPDLMVVKKRRQGQKLVVFGAIAAAAGCVGALLSMVLKVVWLGILGGPIGFLSSVALVVGVICLVVGYTKVKSAHNGEGG